MFCLCWDSNVYRPARSLVTVATKILLSV